MSLSIIIPVHNTEKYLADCLRSLLDSVPDDVEIIIVDDGSTDGSKGIYLRYVAENPQINMKIAYQQNAGVSSARNKGLSLATKDYVCFLDSDDICKPNMHKALLDKIVKSNADFCYCGYNCYNYDMSMVTRSFASSRYISGGGDDVALAFIKDKTYISISAYMVKREIIEESNIRFTSGLRYGEDDEFTLKCLLRSKAAVTVNEALFCYRLSNDGVTANVSLSRFDNPMMSIRLCDYAKQNDEFVKTLKKIYIPTCLLNVVYLLAQSGYDYCEVIKYMTENGLTQYLKGAKGTRPKISVMMFLWKIHPKMLYSIIGYARK